MISLPGPSQRSTSHLNFSPLLHLNLHPYIYPNPHSSTHPYFNSSIHSNLDASFCHSSQQPTHTNLPFSTCHQLSHLNTPPSFYTNIPASINLTINPSHYPIPNQYPRSVLQLNFNKNGTIAHSTTNEKQPKFGCLPQSNVRN